LQWVELLKETLVKLYRLAVMWDPQDDSKIVELKEAQAAAGDTLLPSRISPFGSDRTARFESVVTRTTAINTIFFRPAKYQEKNHG